LATSPAIDAGGSWLDVACSGTSFSISQPNQQDTNGHSQGENMNTPDTQAKIECLALCYKKITGIDLKHMGIIDHRERSWFEFLRAGFTVQDLEIVLLWLKKGVREEIRNPGCLRFSNLIERPDRFGEELAMAKAENRNARPAPTPKELVLAQARPVAVELQPAQAKNTARPVSYWIEKMREAAK